MRLRLINPVGVTRDEWDVYGDPDVFYKSLIWAQGHHLLLVRGVEKCVHGLMMMDTCPVVSGHYDSSCIPFADHTEIWADADRPGDIFILTHPYVNNIPKEMMQYARSVGLHCGVLPHPNPAEDPLADRWYNPHALPIRLSPDEGVARIWGNIWPLQKRLEKMINKKPPTWPVA